MGVWWHWAQGSDDSHPALSCSRKDAACPHHSPQAQPGGPQIGSRLLVFMVISQLCHVQDAALCLGASASLRGRIVPVQSPVSAQSQRINEMSGTGPQPGCAPAAHHSLVSPSGVSTAINQPSAAGRITSLLVPPKWECPCGAQVVSVLLCS